MFSQESGHMIRELNNWYKKTTQKPNSSIVINRTIRLCRLSFVLIYNAILHPNFYIDVSKKVRLSKIPTDPLVSIIVPTFNQEKYLKQCLNSISEQTYRNIEVIIVDDGSNLETKKIIREFATLNQVHVIENSSNFGLPRSLDLGLGSAKGNLLTWVSSDNYLADCFVEKFVREFLLSEGIGIIYSDFEIVNEESKEIGRDFGWRNYDRISIKPNRLTMHRFKSLRKVNPINVVGASFMMRREVFSFVGGHFARQGTEDQSFWINASQGFRFKKLESNGCLYFYRIHKASLTNKLQNHNYLKLLMQINGKTGYGQA
jgi:glycosyltransferase involved in cell wall biosynthesis